MRISDKLREKIEEQIATGELPPGCALEEASLVERFGVSRTPVREALIQLASDGLIEIRPRRGAVVASIGPARLIEMFELMAELEAMCGRLAARRMTDAERAALQVAHETCESARAANDTDSYFYCNEQFHAAIYAGSHNQFLMEQATLLHRRLRPYRRMQLRVRNRMGVSFKEHASIVNLIANADAEATAAALREHVLVQGERFGDLMASMSELIAVAAD